MNLIDALLKGEVDITFKSLNSGKEITKRYTLNTCFKVPQNSQSNKLLAFDILAKEWEDIEKSTIVGWSV